MERTVIRFQKPSNALWLSSHFVKNIDQAWVLLVGSNSVVARAIYGSTQAIRRTTSLVLAWSHGSVITLSSLLFKVKRNKHSHRRQVIASQQPAMAACSNGDHHSAV